LKKPGLLHILQRKWSCDRQITGRYNAHDLTIRSKKSENLRCWLTCDLLQWNNFFNKCVPLIQPNFT